MPPAGSKENNEGQTDTVDPPAGGQENNRLVEKQTIGAERVCSSAGVEPEEDRPMGGEDKREESSHEEMAMREAMLTEQANLDGVGQEGQDLSQTAPEGPTHEAQSSAVENLQTEEKKQVEGRWTHRDTKWMVRSTKWPSQQY